MKNVTKITTSVMGIIAGLASFEHGLGEVFQGNRAPARIVFPSWPTSPFFQNLGGEPAMSIIPNYLVSGILTILFSLIFMLWATRFVHRKNGNLILFFLCIILLLVGGGFGPPLLGLILTAASTRINRPLIGLQKTLPAGFRHFVGRVWPWSLGACVAVWLLLLPGLPSLAYFFGIDNPDLTYLIIALAFGSLILTIILGLVVDCDPNLLAINNRSEDERGTTAFSNRRHEPVAGQNLKVG